MVEFNIKYRPRKIESKDKKRDTYENAYVLYEGQELILNAFKRGIFSIKATKSKGFKRLTPRQVVQRLK